MWRWKLKHWLCGVSKQITWCFMPMTVWNCWKLTWSFFIFVLYFSTRCFTFSSSSLISSVTTTGSVNKAAVKNTKKKSKCSGDSIFKLGKYKGRSVIHKCFICDENRIYNSQNLNWANGLIFAQTKSKPVHLNFVLLCCTFNKESYMTTNTWAKVRFICVNELKSV